MQARSGAGNGIMALAVHSNAAGIHCSRHSWSSCYSLQYSLQPALSISLPIPSANSAVEIRAVT
jgi:hypothetical protein